MAKKTELSGYCAWHGEYIKDVEDSPCPGCEDGLPAQNVTDGKSMTTIVDYPLKYCPNCGGFIFHSHEQRAAFLNGETLACPLCGLQYRYQKQTVNWEGEVAAIYARLYRDMPDDALYMAQVLVSQEAQDQAVAELDTELECEDESAISDKIHEDDPDFYAGAADAERWMNGENLPD